MTNINIELPANIHTKLKLRAIKEGKTIQETVIELLTRRPKK